MSIGFGWILGTLQIKKIYKSADFFLDKFIIDNTYYALMLNLRLMITFICWVSYFVNTVVDFKSLLTIIYTSAHFSF